MKGGLKSASIKHGGQFVVTLTGIQWMPMLCVASLGIFREVRLVLCKLLFWTMCIPITGEPDACT